MKPETENTQELGAVASEVIVAELVEVKYGNNTLRFTNHPANLTMNGETYTSVPYTRDTIEEERGAAGSVQTAITLGDLDGTLKTLVAGNDYLRGSVFRVMFCSVRNSNAVLEADYIFSLKSVAFSGGAVQFNLATSAPWKNQFPPRRMYKARCSWIFKSPQCGYDGSETTCDRTIETCRRINLKGTSENEKNYLNIGCFPGCGHGGLAQ